MREEFGTTIFLTTHFLEEADNLCDQVVIMNLGQVIVTGAPSDLKASLENYFCQQRDLSNLPNATVVKMGIPPKPSNLRSRCFAWRHAR